jgi:hypothetical protein
MAVYSDELPRPTACESNDRSSHHDLIEMRSLNLSAGYADQSSLTHLARDTITHARCIAHRN